MIETEFPDLSGGLDTQSKRENLGTTTGNMKTPDCLNVMSLNRGIVKRNGYCKALDIGLGAGAYGADISDLEVLGIGAFAARDGGSCDLISTVSENDNGVVLSDGKTARTILGIMQDPAKDLGRFYQLTPPNNATDVDTSPTLTWTTGGVFNTSRNDKFIIEIATDITFSDIVVSAIVQPPVGTYTVTDTLEGDTDYWWRVAATDDRRWKWAANKPFKFHTKITEPSTVAIHFQPHVFAGEEYFITIDPIDLDSFGNVLDEDYDGDPPNGHRRWLAGTHVTLTAPETFFDVGNPGAPFIQWNKNGEFFSSERTIEVVIADGDTYEADYLGNVEISYTAGDESNPVDLVITASPADAVGRTSLEFTDADPGFKTFRFVPDTEVTLTAPATVDTVFEGTWSFVKWTLNGEDFEGNDSESIVITAPAIPYEADTDNYRAVYAP